MIIKVLMSTPELLYHAKAGGLADAVFGLTTALVAGNVDARVIVPIYGNVQKFASKNLKNTFELGPEFNNSKIHEVIIKNLTVYAIESEHFQKRNGEIYVDSKGVDWPNNGIAFGMFSEIVASLVTGKIDVGWKPSILHGHDWTSGFAIFKLANKCNKVKTIMSIHNLAHQGIFDLKILNDLGFSRSDLNHSFLEYYGKTSMLKAGLEAADKVITVSPTYSKEVLTKYYGMGLDGVLKSRKEPVLGVLNGIDFLDWNSSTDSYLPVGFD